MNNDELKKYVDVLGDSLGKLLYYSYQDVVQLRLNWRVYRNFFGTNKERIDLLNSISGETSWVLQRALENETFLAIRRLTDPTSDRSNNNMNLSISMFTQHFAEHPERDVLESLITKALDASKVHRKRLDKQIVHAAWEVRTGSKASFNVSRADTAIAIDAIASVIKWVAIKKMNTTLSTVLISDPADETWFLKHLFEGKRKMDEKEIAYRKFTETGNYYERNELYNFPDWISRPDEPKHDIES
jgi:hypothetical protein